MEDRAAKHLLERMGVTCFAVGEDTKHCRKHEQKNATVCFIGVATLPVKSVLSSTTNMYVYDDLHFVKVRFLTLNRWSVFSSKSRSTEGFLSFKKVLSWNPIFLMIMQQLLKLLILLRFFLCLVFVYL